MLKLQANEYLRVTLLTTLAFAQVSLSQPANAAPPQKKPLPAAPDELTLPEIFQLKREGMLASAQSAIDRYLKLHPDDADALIYKCYFLTPEGHSQDILKILDKLIVQKRRSVDAYRLRANMYFCKKKYAEALKDLNVLVPLDPISGPTYGLRARIYDCLGKKKEAAEDRLRDKIVHPLNRTWNKLTPASTGIKPSFDSRTTFANAYAGGQAVLDRFDVTAAYDYFNKAVSLNPTSLAARFYRGTINESLERNAEAIKDFDYIIATGAKTIAIPMVPQDQRNKVVASWPTLVLPIAEAYRRKARCHYALEQCKEMIAAARQVIQGEPEETTAYEMTADMCTGCNMYVEAIEAYRKMELLDPDNKEIIYRLSICYGALKNYKKEVELLTYVIRFNPKDETMYEHRATALSKMGKRKEAIGDLTVMISRAPEVPEAYMRRALEYEQLKDYKSALIDYSKAIELDPYRRISYENRARILYKLGKKDLADKDKAKAQSIID